MPSDSRDRRATHSFYRNRRALLEAPTRPLDGRTKIALLVKAWREILLQDLADGDPEKIPASKLLLVDLVSREAAILDMLDGWLLEQLVGENPERALVVKDKDIRVRRVVLDRGQLSSALAKKLALLGVEPRRRETYLERLGIIDVKSSDGENEK